MMISLFIPLLLGLFNFYILQDIVVEHVYLDRINASVIAEKVDVFDLEKDYINIQDMVITQNFFFICPGEKDSKGFATSVSKLDKSGKYIDEIYRSKQGRIINSIAYYPEKERLLISHGNKIIAFDLISNKIINEVSIEKHIGKSKIFKNKLYVSSIAYNENVQTYYLESYDPLSLELIQIEKKMDYEVGMIKIGRLSSLSINNNELFVSMGKENNIFSSNDGFKNAAIRFKNIYKGKPSLGQIIFSSNQGRIGKFATTKFSFSNKYYVYYYDIKSNKQYLSKSGGNAGIYDDLNDSGFYSPHFTNSDQYLYAYKKAQSNEGKISVVLFKIKS